MTSAQPPLEPRPPQVTDPASSVTGLPAIMNTVSLSIRQMGSARSLKVLGALNQRNGIDCPSCAWPDPDDRSIAEFCENGAKAVASEATRARADPEFFAAHSIDELAGKSDLWLDQAGRLTHPMVLRPGASHYQPIDWDDAFRLIAEQLKSLPSPGAATFYTSGRTSNEAAFLYQLFVRRFGTNNLPDCSNLCHESSGHALSRAIGVGKGTVRLEDFDLADSIWVIGQNPGTNHPRMLSTLERAARRGCQIVSVNPLREPGLVRFKHPQKVRGILGRGTALASLFVPVRVGGDVAFFKGLMKRMLELDAALSSSKLDHAFIREHTHGFDAFRKDLVAESWDLITAESGIEPELFERAALAALNSKRMICCWAMGITQHVQAVANIQSIVNLLLLGGHLGRPGAGACPVRGHSNVQGDRTMGIGERMPEWFLSSLSKEFAFEAPRQPGLDVVESLSAMLDGRVRAFLALGGNLLSAAPDTERTAAAMRRCELTVQVSTKLNRSHLVTGRCALILPCLGRTERDVQGGTEQVVSVEDSMSFVHASRGVLPPASEHLLSEVNIVCRMARAVLGPQDSVDWELLSRDYASIRSRISRTIPGFENCESRLTGGFYLPNAVRERQFETASRRAEFNVHSIPRTSLAPGQLVLTTIRTHDQFNTTVYGNDDRYRGIFGGRRVLLIGKDDLDARGLSNGQLVDIVSHHATGEREGKAFRLVEYEMPRRCAAAYFPEANVLVPMGHVSAGSNQPASKSVVISIRPSVV